MARLDNTPTIPRYSPQDPDPDFRLRARTPDDTTPGTEPEPENTTPTPPDRGGGTPGGPADVAGPVTVPQNFYEIIKRSADQYLGGGNSVNLLIGLLTQESGIRPLNRSQDGINHNRDGTVARCANGSISRDRGIAQINSCYDGERGLNESTDEGSAAWARSVYNPYFAIEWAATHLRDLYNNPEMAKYQGLERWKNALAAYNGGIGGYTATGPQGYAEAVLGKAGQATRDIIIGKDSPIRDPSQSRAEPIPGLSEDDSEVARAIADGLFVKYLGRLPTTAEYTNIIHQRWTGAVVEDWLRRLKIPGSTATIGEAAAMRSAAHEQARAIFGRDATEGEIQWLLSNKIPVTHVSAYYEQVRDKSVWGTDPENYRATRDQVRTVFNEFGIQVVDKDIPADLVNSSIGKPIDTVRAIVGQRQAPGMPAGVTLDQTRTARELATPVWNTYFPARRLTDDFLRQMVNLSPMQMIDFVRALPSQENPAIAAGIFYDTKQIATGVLQQLGMIGRLPKVSEVSMIATGKMDIEGVSQYYANLPELVAINQGLPYRKGREQYYRERLELEKSHSQLFGTAVSGGLEQRVNEPAAPPSATPPPKIEEPEWIRELFKAGTDAGIARKGFATYFRNLGRPPTIDEVRQFKSKIDMQYGGGVVDPQTETTELGPVAASLGGPRKNVRGVNRQKVSRSPF